MYRVLICGSRGFENYTALLGVLAAYDRNHDGLVVVEGCARGADRLAERAAQYLGIQVEHHPADWTKYGKAAGFRRNVEMLESGVDLVIAFWDGQSRGTKHTMDQAVQRGIRVLVHRFSTD